MSKIKIDKKTFAVPGRFAKAKIASEVAVAEDRKEVETIFSDLDFGRPFGTNGARDSPVKH